MPAVGGAQVPAGPDETAEVGVRGGVQLDGQIIDAAEDFPGVRRVAELYAPDLLALLNAQG